MQIYRKREEKLDSPLRMYHQSVAAARRAVIDGGHLWLEDLSNHHHTRRRTSEALGSP